MPTVIDGILPAVLAARGIAGEVGIRIHTVARVVKFANRDPRSELGEEETPIVEGGGYPPKVRWLTHEELAVGSLAAGTVEVGPITPTTTGGGTDIALLRGDDLVEGDKLYFRIKGPKHPGGALYRRTGLHVKATGYRLQLAPVELENKPDE